MRSLRALILLLTAIGISIGLASPASADDLRFNAKPGKVVVNQSYENVRWQLRGEDTQWIESTDIYLEHMRSRDTADLDFVFDYQHNGVLRFDDYSPYGRYRIHGAAYDYDYNEYSVTPAYLWIKAASRSPLTAARTGAFVTLRTHTQRYNGSYPTWAHHRGAVIKFQRKGTKGWTTIVRRTVPKNGVSQVRVRQPRAMIYRVAVTEGKQVWDSVSRSVRK